eukprot:1071673-Prymnesium_polylepis.2
MNATTTHTIPFYTKTTFAQIRGRRRLGAWSVRREGVTNTSRKFPQQPSNNPARNVFTPRRIIDSNQRWDARGRARARSIVERDGSSCCIPFALTS